MPIELRNVVYNYDPDGPGQHVALSDINLTFREGEFVGIIGHTGSGKSTLIQHLNGLVEPSEGEVLYQGENIFKTNETDASGRKLSRKKLRRAKAESLRRLRQRVGLVFQYPEYQLFEQTVAKDIAYGPTNMGFSEEECGRIVKESLRMVGLSEEIMEKSPFELSGGQKRRVAIAGVLAMQPDFLILDEPTAGLDPRGRDEILGQIKKLQQEKHLAVILVSHSMEDVATYVDRIIALKGGRVIYDDQPEAVFTKENELREMGLDIPETTRLANRLREKGLELPNPILTREELVEHLKKALSNRG